MTKRKRTEQETTQNKTKSTLEADKNALIQLVNEKSQNLSNPEERIVKIFNQWINKQNNSQKILLLAHKENVNKLGALLSTLSSCNNSDQITSVMSVINSRSKLTNFVDPNLKAYEIISTCINCDILPSITGMQCGRGMIEMADFNRLIKLCGATINNGTYNYTNLDRFLLKSITGMQNGKGMIKTADFNRLIELCGATINNGTYNYTNLDRFLLKSITRMQAGRGMIETADFEKLIELCGATINNGTYNYTNLDRSLLKSITRMQADRGMIETADFEKLIEKYGGVINQDRTYNYQNFNRDLLKSDLTKQLKKNKKTTQLSQDQQNEDELEHADIGEDTTTGHQPATNSDPEFTYNKTNSNSYLDSVLDPNEKLPSTQANSLTALRFNDPYGSQNIYFTTPNDQLTDITKRKRTNETILKTNRNALIQLVNEKSQNLSNPENIVPIFNQWINKQNNSQKILLLAHKEPVASPTSTPL